MLQRLYPHLHHSTMKTRTTNQSPIRKQTCYALHHQTITLPMKGHSPTTSMPKHQTTTRDQIPHKVNSLYATVTKPKGQHQHHNQSN